MSSNLRNPFNILYATEGINDLDFPRIFSPTLIPLVMPLFQAGNFILSGTQGTGKSMLLALLDTDVRLAFWTHDEHGFPVDSEFCKYVGASINLSNSLVLKFTERDFGGEDSIARSQALFSDYLNTWVLRDLLSSIERLINKAPKARLKECGVSTKQSLLDEAVCELAKNEVCRGLLAGAKTVEQAVDALTRRRQMYIDFLNFRYDKIPEEIWSTITGIGEPLSIAAETLRRSTVLDSTTEVFVTIDQCEELLRLEQNDTTGRQYGRFREMLDKLISSREKAVSYRLGTRPNAIWKGKAEEARDYSRIDLDMLLRGKEHAKSIFPRLAQDVFIRRLEACGIEVDYSPDVLKKYFGPSPKAPERAKECAVANKPERIIVVEKDNEKTGKKGWPAEIKQLLYNLATENILSAKLGEAWVRQNFSRLDAGELVKEVASLPWEQREKQWWRKERRPIAVLQIAARSGERIRYYGKNDILILSGKNILVFGLICQKIWEIWIESLDLQNSPDVVVPSPFPPLRQGIGIDNASNIWRTKISSAPSGDTLGRFVDTLGTRLRIQLRGDKPMSYPGANGISLTDADVANDPEIEGLLNDATAEGFLQVLHHTPKTQSRGRSKKWYLHPVLSPYYELTVARTKEPLYLKITELRKWLEKTNVVDPTSSKKKPAKKKLTKKGPTKRKSDPSQGTLFDDEEIQ